MGLKVSAIKCSNCGDTIYSRCQHDYNTCSCSKEDCPDFGVSIDGGLYCVHFGWGNKQEKPELIQIELDDGISTRDLYDDWNKRINKHGKIKS